MNTNRPKPAYGSLLFMDLEGPMVLGMKYIQHKSILSCTGFMISKVLVIWHFNNSMAELHTTTVRVGSGFVTGLTIILSITEADEHPT